jgi:hypothetical protein
MDTRDDGEKRANQDPPVGPLPASAEAATSAGSLPVAGLRRASRVLSEAVNRVSDDSLFVRQILGLTLTGYVTQLPGDYSSSMN